MTIPFTDITEDDTAAHLAELIKEELPYEPPPVSVFAHLNAYDPPLPDRFQSFRILPDGSSPQWDAICDIVVAFESGAKVVLLEAPTGAGKTLIAETVRRLLETRGVFTCTSISLQDQILRDFGDYAHVLKGRSNYPTLDNPSITADDCMKERAILPACTNCPGWTSKQSTWGTSGLTSEDDSIAEGDGTGVQGSWGGDETGDVGVEAMHCTWCHPAHACPYELAKRGAIASRLAVLNTAYLLAETNKVAKSKFSNHPFIIIDEADTLERQLMGFVGVEISAKIRKMLGVGLPKKKTVADSWAEWIGEEVIPAVQSKMDEVDSRQRTLDGADTIETIRLRRRLERLWDDVGKLTTWNAEEGKHVFSEGWVCTGYDKDNENSTVVFKPVTVEEYGQDQLWRHGQRFLVMSATFLSAQDTAEQLGLEDDEWAFVEVEYSFDPMRRPVFPLSVGVMNSKNKAEMYPKMIEAIADIMEDHPDVRILVHTHSYELTKAMYFAIRGMGGEFQRRVMTYLNAGEREQALRKYKTISNGVLFAPSFDRGVDLPDDECRVQIICKVPFPFLGDEQVSTRFYGTGMAGKIWFQMEALRTMIQQTGRAMRHDKDYCRTYILDSTFNRMWRDYRRLFPKWWESAIVWDENDPKWNGLIG